MAIHTTSPGQVIYGPTIGILCAEWNIPSIPGDLNNPYTFDFPVRHELVEGALGSEVLTGDADQYAEMFAAAAQRLEAQGVRAITSNCGYMAAFQPTVAAAVDIPVFMSSLMQLPLLQTMIGTTGKIAVLVASGGTMHEGLLERAGVTNLDNLVFKGIDHHPHWHDVIIKQTGKLDDELLRDEVVAAAQEVMREHPDVVAFMSECSMLPFCSADVQDATGRPVFDWAGFVRFVHDAVNQRTYSGPR